MCHLMGDEHLDCYSEHQATGVIVSQYLPQTRQVFCKLPRRGTNKGSSYLILSLPIHLQLFCLFKRRHFLQHGRPALPYACLLVDAASFPSTYVPLSPVMAIVSQCICMTMICRDER